MLGNIKIVKRPPNMTDTLNAIPLHNRIGKIVTFAAIAVVLLKAILALPDMLTTFVVSRDSDDIMRLMSIRSWQDGQSWFDMHQYRLLSPEGVSIHWSRLIDAAIAGLIGLFALVMEPQNAEMWGIAFWPPLLLIAMILVVSRGTQAVMGGWSGALAVGSVFLWGATGGMYFEPGRIDHHNVQILLTTIAGFALIQSGPPIRQGCIAGLASALSLAVGLEGLLVIAMFGLILLVRAAYDKAQAVSLLVAFCVSLLIGAFAFFVAQTAPRNYAALVCDQLSVPVMTTAGISVVACLASLALRRWITSPVVRILIVGVVAVIGILLAHDLLTTCFVGPYGQLPQNLQDLIANTIIETQGAFVSVRLYPAEINLLVTPIVGAVVAGAIVFYNETKRGALTAAQSSAITQMLVIGTLGLVGVLLQIRLAVMAAPAVGFLTGFVLSTLLAARAHQRSGRNSFMLIVAIFFTLLAPTLNAPAAMISNLRSSPTDMAEAGRPVVAEAECLRPEVLETLNNLPSARVFTSLGMGPPLLLLTHHIGLAAPYHRSATALSNGFTLFSGDEAALQAAMNDVAANYLVLCRGTRQGREDSFASSLAMGEDVTWLSSITDGVSDKLVVLAVTP